jgi:hypothetical protein
VSQDRKARIITLTALPADLRLAELLVFFLSDSKAEDKYEDMENIQSVIILTSMLSL